MSDFLPIKDQLTLIMRGVQEIYSKEDLIKKLEKTARYALSLAWTRQLLIYTLDILWY